MSCRLHCITCNSVILGKGKLYCRRACQKSPNKGNFTGIFVSCVNCRKEFYCTKQRIKKFCTWECFQDYAVSEGTKKLRVGYKHSKLTKKRMRKAWTTERRKVHSKQMRKGGVQQDIMQMYGNDLQVGVPRPEVTEWYINLSTKEKAIRREASSKRVAKRMQHQYRSYSRGIQGWIGTKFGPFRYDSTWERDFIQSLTSKPYVSDLRRDFPIVYYDVNNIKRRFLIDFRVERLDKRPVLVEIKCPYFLNTVSTKLKIRAAKKYAKKHGMKFSLLVSKKEAVKGTCI